jgi:hypothetical protein
MLRLSRLLYVLVAFFTRKRAILFAVWWRKLVAADGGRDPLALLLIQRVVNHGSRSVRLVRLKQVREISTLALNSVGIVLYFLTDSVTEYGAGTQDNNI